MIHFCCFIPNLFHFNPDNKITVTIIKRDRPEYNGIVKLVGNEKQ